MARYDSMRKMSRNQELYQFRLDNPNLSWEEIGEQFHISGQRAGKVFRMEAARMKEAAGVAASKGGRANEAPGNKQSYTPPLLVVNGTLK